VKAIAEKNYTTKFRISEEEFRRIREIIFDQYNKVISNDTIKEKVIVNLSNGSVITDLGFDDLFNLSNEGSESINAIEIHFSKSEIDNDHTIKERDWTFVLASMLDERLVQLKCHDLKSTFSFASLFGWSLFLGFLTAIIYAVVVSFLPPTKSTIESNITRNQTNLDRMINLSEIQFPDSLRTPSLSQLLNEKLSNALSPKQSLVEYEKIKEESTSVEHQYALKRLEFSIDQIKVNNKDKYVIIKDLQAKTLELKNDLEFHSYRDSSSGIFLRLFKFLGFVIYPIFIITIFVVRKYTISNGYLWGVNKQQFESNQSILKTYFIVIVLGILVSIVGGIIANAL